MRLYSSQAEQGMGPCVRRPAPRIRRSGPWHFPPILRSNATSCCPGENRVSGYSRKLLLGNYLGYRIWLSIVRHRIRFRIRVPKGKFLTRNRYVPPYSAAIRVNCPDPDLRIRCAGHRTHKPIPRSARPLYNPTNIDHCDYIPALYRTN